MQVLAFAVAVTFIPWIGGIAHAPRWAVLSVFVPVLLCLRSVHPNKLTAGHLFGGLFIAWAAAGLTWTSGIYDGIDLVWRLCVLAGVFALGARCEDLTKVWTGFAIGMALNSLLAVLQWYGPWEAVRDAIPQGPMPAGTFLNKNYLAEPAALALVAMLACRRWWIAAALVPAVWLPGTRGAFLAVAVAMLAWLWAWDRKVTLLIVLVAAMVGVAAMPHLIPDGVAAASVSQRFAIWKDTLEAMTIWGHGTGSYFTSYAAHSPDFNLLRSRPSHAHNDILELFYELGPGALLACAFLIECLRGTAKVERLVLLAFLTESMFAFPLHNPATAFCMALAAGQLSRSGVPVRDLVARWRGRIRARAMA